jgi:hypothetical protein
MRLPVVLVGALLAVVVAVLAVAVATNRDTFPDDLAACVRRSGGQLVRSNDTLGALRADLSAGAVRERRLGLGDRDAVVLEGTGYRILAVAARDGAPPERGAALAVFRRPSAFSVVAVERGGVRVVEDCARTAAA